MDGLPPRTPRLMESDRDVALMVALPRGAYTDVVMCFPILTDAGEWNTNWPLLPSFPLFWRNVLYTLGNIRDAAGEETIQPGQVKLIRPEGRVPEIKVTDPKNQTTTLERGSRADFAYGATDRVGPYKASWDGGGGLEGVRDEPLRRRRRRAHGRHGIHHRPRVPGGAANPARRV